MCRDETRLFCFECSWSVPFLNWKRDGERTALYLEHLNQRVSASHHIRVAFRIGKVWAPSVVSSEKCIDDFVGKFLVFFVKEWFRHGRGVLRRVGVRAIAALTATRGCRLSAPWN